MIITPNELKKSNQDASEYIDYQEKQKQYRTKLTKKYSYENSEKLVDAYIKRTIKSKLVKFANGIDNLIGSNKESLAQKQIIKLRNIEKELKGMVVEIIDEINELLNIDTFNF